MKSKFSCQTPFKEEVRGERHEGILMRHDERRIGEEDGTGMRRKEYGEKGEEDG
jgi:hypothetical protein